MSESLIGILFLVVLIFFILSVLLKIRASVTDPENHDFIDEWTIKQNLKKQRQGFCYNNSSGSPVTTDWSSNSIFSDNHHQSSFLQNDYLTNPSNPMNPSFGQCGTLNSSSPNYIWQDFGK